MKKIITIIAALLMTANVWSQHPNMMSYQAVIRNSDDKLMTNTSVGMQISIIQSSTTGTAVYVERQFPTTNSNGLVSIEIGGSNATTVSGNISTIDWSNGPYFIKTETDLNGGSNYTISGTSQLLTVPYAMHAKTADQVNITGDETAFVGWDKDASDDFDGNYTSLEGKPKNVSSFVNDAGYITNPDDNDADSTNELQTLSLFNKSLRISNGNSVSLEDIAGNRTISFPAFSITRSPTTSIITEDATGLLWQQSASTAARILIKKPTNYEGGDVTFSILFRTKTEGTGIVDMFIRPNSFSHRDLLTDSGGITSKGTTVSATIGKLYEQSFIIPADRLTKDWWEIKIQRRGTKSTYTDDIIVMSAALAY